MRILFLNWRCPTHPQAGGAELLTLRIAERLVRWGHTVSWFAAGYARAAPEETIGGIRVVRAGSQASVHLQAYRWYRRCGRGQFDVVVDEVNTIPFFAHRYAGIPTLVFINQLAREVWWYEAPQPLAALGYLLEPLYLGPYRRLPFVSISESSAESLRAQGMTGSIRVLPMATDFTPGPALPPMTGKEAERTLVCLGRVVPSKRVDHAIRAVSHLQQQGLSAHLWVVGQIEPRYRVRLERLAARLGVSERLTFWGRVEEADKRALLRRAHLLVACSVREGWGLMVTEANAVGTPAVVYDVPGLRDSTRAGETGWVCEANTPEALAQALGRLWEAPDEYERLRAGAWEQSRGLSWDRTAQSFLEALNAVAGQRPVQAAGA